MQSNDRLIHQTARLRCLVSAGDKAPDVERVQHNINIQAIISPSPERLRKLSYVALLESLDIYSRLFMSH